MTDQSEHEESVRAPRRRAPGQPAGEKHSRARFTNEQVRELRAAYATGECSYRGLAERWNAKAMTIRDVLTWKSYPLAGGHTSSAKIWEPGKPPRKANPAKAVLVEGERLTELPTVAPW